ncbi:MAG: diaminopropionate ammonia-lyase [Gemmatimonadales bacterium]
MQLLLNPLLDRNNPYSDALRTVLSHRRAREVEREIASWPDYEPTPLMDLPGLAEHLGIQSIGYKDEAARFGLGSFKALGGAYGVLRVLQQLAGARHAGDVTVTCATDGNHGRAVAWGASMFGCRSVIYLPSAVSENRAAAIAELGADTVRVHGTYDDAVRQVERDAKTNHWMVVSDTSYPGYTDIPRDIMQGYTVLVYETLRQLPGGVRPTHVFVQAGVGGLAAAVCAHLWEQWGADRPLLVVVEPENAACVFASAVTGRPMPLDGAVESVMACLVAGSVSLEAWRVLKTGADAFMTVSDGAAEAAMGLLAGCMGGDPAIVAGESGVGGLAGLLTLSEDQDARRSVRLGPDSRVLLIGTEGATDPEIYERIVGRTPRQVNTARLW